MRWLLSLSAVRLVKRSPGRAMEQTDALQDRVRARFAVLDGGENALGYDPPCGRLVRAAVPPAAGACAIAGAAGRRRRA